MYMGATWYAKLKHKKLLLLFSCEDTLGRDVDAAFVRWFEAVNRRPLHVRGFKLQPLRWEMHKPRGRPSGTRTDSLVDIAL